ncbi:unnamed protein product [Mytilus edulis]|uniref:Uncharacterized protein n=1 Tax=Mytilus edulis TaxID=6550 RepID=A0A8S3S9J8_MYTED|nr:unnamed protein product [Mytilus edulis]
MTSEAVKPTQSLVTSQICKKCDNVASVSMCDVVEICNKDEVCYMRKYINDMFNERFDLGCVEASVCYMRKYINDMFNERVDLGCVDASVCYMRKYINDMFNERFDLGCVEASMCSHSNTLTSHLIGKRTNSNIDRFILCEACCNGSSQCNSHLDCKHQSSS